MLQHRLLLRRPQPKVGGRAARQLLCNRVVSQALNGLVVVVLQDALGLVRPNNHLFVCTARGELLAMPRVRYAEDAVLVALQRVDKVPVRGIVDEHTIARRHDDLWAIRLEGDAPDAIAVFLTFWDLV